VFTICLLYWYLQQDAAANNWDIFFSPENNFPAIIQKKNNKQK